ncbi:MAG: putative metal-binding motif-containing protein [Alphaproteobacteria bacterium]|nr:putative metal-binding motif-containing protein [Alphaproteobacteria bacterium]MCB9690809.1 putative metal-binding motif-containing protein [Alphaproteobacteria bacterium]
MPLRLLGLLALTGCWVSEQSLVDAQDRDGDGFLPVELGGDDCAPDDPAVHPGALELCGDGVDNDCDGLVDDQGVGALTFFQDDDGDGFGRELTAIQACAAPPGHAAIAGDCDDADADRRPGVADACNGVDDDCDGFVDEDEQPIVQFPDDDQDGHGDFARLTRACVLLPHHVYAAGDCDDTDGSIHNDASDDNCDGVDNDCDGVPDDDAPYADWFPDVDGDAWGDADALAVRSCLPVPDHVTNQGDCDDTNPTINPGATDICDGIDQDCDGALDDDSQVTLYFLDLDGDGAGAPGTGFESCGDIPGAVLDDDDCNDADPGIRPGVEDLCDGVDQDCDQDIDEDAPRQVWYPDDDDDNWGLTSQGVLSCAQPPGHVDDPGDCDDADPSVHPGQVDACNATDDDCDGAADEDATFSVWYPDADGDLWGLTTAGVLACAQPAGHQPDGGDCDDTDGAVHPGVVDLCDGTDSDCDGQIDDDATFVLVFPDADGDGLGNGSLGFSTCAPPSGTVTTAGDCDDTRANVTVRTWYPDTDADGFGAPPGITICDQPAAHVSNDDDCDDTLATVSPNRPEVCGDGLDNDCSTATDCAWSGTTLDGEAQIDLTPQAGWFLGALPDLNQDEVGEYWVAKPTATQVFYGRATPPNLTGTPDLTFPAGCRLHAVDGVGDAPITVVCTRSGEVRLYPEPPSNQALVVTGVRPGFGRIWAAGRSGLWIGSDDDLRFYVVQIAAFTESDANVEIRVAAQQIAVVQGDADDVLFLLENDTLHQFSGLVPGIYGLSDALVSSGQPSTSVEIDTVRLGRYQTALQVHTYLTSPVVQSVTHLHLPPWTIGEDPLSGGLRALGFPNEALTHSAVPDATDDGELDWAMRAGTTYSRIGLVYRGESGDSYATDVDAWFVESGASSDLELLLVADMDADGDTDLVFRDTAGHLLVHLRDLQ